MLKLVSIYKTYSLNNEKAIPVLSDLNLCLNNNKTLVIFGENGSGKTTLLNIIYGKDLDFKGKIIYNNKDITKLPFVERASNFLLLHQNRNTGLPETLTLLEVYAIIKNDKGLFLHKKRYYKELFSKLNKI